jgi:anti-sigma factor RsiW
MNDCDQTKTLLMLAADGELAEEESARLEEHVQSCAACHAERARLQELDRYLGAYAGVMTYQSQPRLTAPRGGVRSAMQWLAHIAAALAALLLLGVILIHRIPSEKSAGVSEESFVPIPYVQPLDPYATATVMRMEVPVATLIAFGYRMDASDLAAVVTADVLVGEDGRAHAVHVLSGSVMN